MSQDIVCKECQYENPLGSKFCNNCGAKLPLGTHIICNNCGTSNTIDRIFCDHCGTRLLPDIPPVEEEKKVDPTPATGKAFTLPTRKPGETGDLDPQNVPDWLKTGKTRQGDEDEGLDSEDLPRVEELTQKQPTGDLPEWLVDEEDSDPIIHAPTIISTEFYKDLLEKAEDAPQLDDLFPEDDKDSKLPDWLQDAGTGSLGAKAQPVKDEPTKGLTEFLSDVTDYGEDEAEEMEPEDESLTSWLSKVPEKPDTAVTPAKDSAGLTEWLSDADAEDSVDEPLFESDDGLTDWLDSVDPALEAKAEQEAKLSDSLTSWLSDEPPTAAKPEEGETESSGLTEWLSEVPGSAAPPATEPVKDLPGLSDSLTGWLAELPDEETAVPDAPQPEDESLTDWFSETDQPAPEKAEATPEFSESLTGWLSELPADETAEDEDFEAFDDEWSLADETAGAGTPDQVRNQADRLTDWLDDDDEDDFVEEVDFSDRLTNWLTEEEAVSSVTDGDNVAAEPTAAATTDSDLDDWFAADDDDDDDDDPEFDDFPADEWQADEPLQSRLTDWLPAVPDPQEEIKDTEAVTPKKTDAVAAWLNADADAEAEEAEERFDWLDEPETPVTASGKHEIPSNVAWLEETEEELSNIFQSQPTIEEDLPDWLAGVAEDGDTFISEVGGEEIGDLEDIFSAEQKAAETELDFLQQTGSLRMDSDWADELGLEDADADSDALAELIGSDEPGWLSDLAEMGVGGLNLPDETELDTAVDDLSALLDEESLESEDSLEEVDLFLAESLAMADIAGGMSGEDEFADEYDEDFFPEPIEDEGDLLPDWINKLDATGDLPEMDDSEFIASEEMPEWVANLKPGQNLQESVLPGALMEELPETLAGVPEELAGSDLPDWLQDMPQTAAEDVPLIPVSADTQMSDIPDWLQGGMEQSEADSDIFGTSGSGLLDPTPVSDEWGAILNDLPPAVPIRDTLSKAEIPEWVMDLKPAELTGEAPKTAPVPQGPEETYGPLSGLRGVVVVEPVIAQPRMAAAPAPFVVSPEQHQQVLLLHQLAQNGHDAQQKGKTKQAGRDISGWTRPLFALILILVIVIGLQGTLPISLPTNVPAPVAGMNTAVTAAAGETVLVAFEYSPAMAGELTPEAETLLAQLAENESTILTISQYAAGVPIATAVIDDVEIEATNLGYLPGGAIGLRGLGECLDDFSGSENCDALFAESLTAEQQTELENIALIIVLTANRENLVAWIEQVGTPTEKAMAAGVTQSLNPIASPYFDTQQLLGVLNGIPGTAVYQDQFFMSDQATEVKPLFNAQITAEIMLFVVLLLGAIIYIISGYVAQRRQK